MFAFVEKMAGREIGRTTPEPKLRNHTPSWKSLVAQDVVEEELFAVVRNSRHGQVLFSTECMGFEADAERRGRDDAQHRHGRREALAGAST